MCLCTHSMSQSNPIEFDSLDACNELFETVQPIVYIVAQMMEHPSCTCQLLFNHSGNALKCMRQQRLGYGIRIHAIKLHQ